MAELYQTKEATTRFGTKLAVNSAGQIVLEMKGESGKVEAFAPDDIEMVTPYTICVVSENGSSFDIESIPGKFNVGDILFDFKGIKFWKVTRLDTKIHNCSKAPWSSGVVKLLTESLKADSSTVVESDK